MKFTQTTTEQWLPLFKKLAKDGYVYYCYCKSWKKTKTIDTSNNREKYATEMASKWGNDTPF